MPEKQYTRLTRARSRSGFAAVSVGRASLWLGSDHLLSVESTGYRESYKRFYFRDIQAVTIRHTKLREIWTLILSVIIGIMLLIAALVQEAVATWVLGAIAAFFAIPLIVNLALGPGAVCHLRTAVQTEELVSLNRIRRARRVLERLRPLIAAAQGQLAPEEIPERLRQLSNSVQPAASSGSPQPARFIVDDPNAPPRIVS